MSRVGQSAAAALLLCALQGPSIAAPALPELAAFAGLAGCWVMEQDGSRYEEWWMPPTTNQMLGMARTLRAGRTVAFEYVRILRDEAGLAYLAYPGGRGPTRFELTSWRDATARFENLQNDFPTHISYSLRTRDQVDARISGALEGRTREIHYPLRRVDCPPTF